MKRIRDKSAAERLKEVVRGFRQSQRPLDGAAQFGRFYEEKHLLVFRHIYGLCGGPTALAEDLTAETFLRAWQARNTFTGDGQAAVGWLLRIGRNLVIDYQRRGIEQKTADFADDFEAAGTERPEEALISAERQQLLMTLLQELPVQKREMITLRYLLGWRVSEIAAYLEMPENTVSVSIQRTLRQMRYRWPVAGGRGGVSEGVRKEQENV